MPEHKLQKTLGKAVVGGLLVAMMLWASGPALTIIPQLVPTANKRGNSNVFQLNAAGAVSGDCATFDANLNITGAGTGGGCGVGGGSVSSVDGSAQNGVETIQGGSVAAITTAGTVRGAMAVRNQTGTSDTILTTDRGKVVTNSNGSAIAVTLPQAGVNFPAAWFYCTENRGAGTVTITPTTSTIDGAANVALTTNQGICVVSDGTNYFTFNRGIGGASGAAGGALSGTYPNPLIANMTTATCMGFVSASTGIITQGTGSDGQPCNIFFLDTSNSNRGKLFIRGNMAIDHANLNNIGYVFGNSNSGMFYNNPTIYFRAGSNNTQGMICSESGLATITVQGNCSFGTANSNSWLFQLVGANSGAFGAGDDGIGALRAVSGNGSAVTTGGGLGKNGGPIQLTTGDGGNGSTTDGNGGDMTFTTGVPGAGAGTDGLAGNIILKIGNATRWTLNAASHILTGGTAPTLSSCGSGPSITGNDISGTVTHGTSANGCTITFATAYAAAPTCTVTNRGGIVFTYTTSTTALTLTETGELSSTLIDYRCDGH